LDHVSYHKIKLGEENFAALTNSKLEFFLHFINLRKNNEDKIIGRGLIEFNRLLLSKDFFLNLNLDIFNYIEPIIDPDVDNEKDKNKKNLNSKKPLTKKYQGR
jgi:hypothetical protein